VIQPIQPETAPVGAAPAAEAPASPSVDAPEGTLVSVPAEAPVLDGMADDAAWAAAAPITFRVSRGYNDFETEVTLKSVYDGSKVYFLATWADPTNSFLRSPWMKNDDGSWSIMKDPDDKGGDNNLFYEDKMAIIWTINNSIAGFESDGCWTACHRPEDTGKPYGNKYTENEGELGDIWHWKMVRNVGQIDDQYLDWTPWSPDTPNAGRKSDPNDGGGYKDNWIEDKSLPAFMAADGGSKDGAPGFILDADKVPFDDGVFAAGEMLPSVVVAPFVGDRADIAAGWQWADGQWTLEFGRDLVTDGEFDVQFADLSATYFFGLAVFDNAQVRHAFHNNAQALVFKP
jgi:hypothetical protein